MTDKTYSLEKNRLTVQQYQELRNTTNWKPISCENVKRSIAHDLFQITVWDKETLLGMGRVIGDGGIYFYIQDVIVKPEYQNKGLGSLLMEEIEEFLNKHAQENAFIGLMAANEAAKFYGKFGYKIRPKNGPGMFKMITKE